MCHLSQSCQRLTKKELKNSEIHEEKEVALQKIKRYWGESSLFLSVPIA